MDSRRLRRAAWAAAIGLGIAAIADRATAAGEPLHRAIDRQITAALGDQAEGLERCTDAEFVRRAWLDLAGIVPTAAEARAFLDDPSPYKRRRMIDRLLDSPTYARRMAQAFDVMWMERRADVNVPAAEWREFLRASFAANVPYDQLVRAILSADGADPATRPAARFVLDRGAEPYTLTRDVARMFLGRDVQCSQCHDHPLIEDYKQAHYYGLFAFVSRIAPFADPALGGKATVGEKAEGDVTFRSVFKKGVEHKTGPRVLDDPPLEEPAGAEYYQAPADKLRGVPKHSRRALLAPSLAGGGVPEFDRNAANRLWAIVIGRGIVHPLDLHHGENPPSHPELLDLLAREFAASGYDIKNFVRELALSRTYERAGEPPPGASEDLADPSRFAVATVRPLSPEQFAWSAMQATGLVERVRAEEVDRIDRIDTKLRDVLDADPARRARRPDWIEAAVAARLESGVAPFATQFGGAAGQPQDADDSSVHQALFLANGGALQNWVVNGGLVPRLEPMADPDRLADELYLAALARRPDADERASVARYLADRGADHRTAALRELVGALLTSAEFRFNH